MEEKVMDEKLKKITKVFDEVLDNKTTCFVAFVGWENGMTHIGHLRTQDYPHIARRILQDKQMMAAIEFVKALSQSDEEMGKIIKEIKKEDKTPSGVH